MPRRAEADEARRSPSLACRAALLRFEIAAATSGAAPACAARREGCEVSRTSASIRPAPCRGSAEPLMSRGIRSARAAGCAYRHIEHWCRERVRPGRARLPHHALEKLAAAPAAVARLLGKPATLLWPASSTNPTYSSNHSGADSVAPYVEVLMATVMSGSRAPEQGRWPSGATRTLRMVPTPWRPRLLRFSSSAQLDRSARYGIVAKTGSGLRQWQVSEMRKSDDSRKRPDAGVFGARLDAGPLRSNGMAIIAPDAASS